MQQQANNFSHSSYTLLEMSALTGPLEYKFSFPVLQNLRTFGSTRTSNASDLTTQYEFTN